MPVSAAGLCATECENVSIIQTKTAVKVCITCISMFADIAVRQVATPLRELTCRMGSHVLNDQQQLNPRCKKKCVEWVRSPAGSSWVLTLDP